MRNQQFSPRQACVAKEIALRSCEDTSLETNEISEHFDACCECRTYKQRERTTTLIRSFASAGSVGESNILTLFEK